MHTYKICGKYTYLYMYMYIHLSHRGKSVRVFLFGDYEFQCRMYGISGAQGKKTTTCTCTMHLSLKIHAGRHPCLWCTIRADQLKLPQHERGKLPLRTLDSLKADYLRFETIGKREGDQRRKRRIVDGHSLTRSNLLRTGSCIRHYLHTECHLLCLFLDSCRRQQFHSMT